jgi:hypothetical protein
MFFYSCTTPEDGVSISLFSETIGECEKITLFSDLNGLRDDNEEVISTSNICNGENGASIKAITSTTTDCTNGGVKYSFYGDTNNNNALDENESIINESVVCNGERGVRGYGGSDGSNGTDGANGSDGSNGSPIKKRLA